MKFGLYPKVLLLVIVRVIKLVDVGFVTLKEIVLWFQWGTKFGSANVQSVKLENWTV